MGTDIHPHIEVKVNGKWEHYSQPLLQRYYALFALIAGVRANDRPSLLPIAEDRGLPPDISTVTRLDYDKNPADYYGATWLTAEELRRVVKWHMQDSNYIGIDVRIHQWGWLFGKDMSTFNLDRLPVEDVRFVCWFDS